MRGQSRGCHVWRYCRAIQMRLRDCGGGGGGGGWAAVGGMGPGCSVSHRIVLEGDERCSCASLLWFFCAPPFALQVGERVHSGGGQLGRRDTSARAIRGICRLLTPARACRYCPLSPSHLRGLSAHQLIIAFPSTPPTAATRTAPSESESRQLPNRNGSHRPFMTIPDGQVPSTTIDSLYSTGFA